MIFLLPPSESKQVGGTKQKSALSLPELNQARALILKRLVELSKSPKQAALALKLGPKQLGELQVNLELVNPKVLPAIDRYTGVLYDALKLNGLSKRQLARAGETVFIQSSLFGLISALDEIPNYRLSAGSKLPDTNLKSIWIEAHQQTWQRFQSEVVIDLRSKAYAALNPIPKQIDSYEVEVLSEDGSGVRKALNHFNKQAKGNFTRSVISHSQKPKKLSDLKKIAKLSGMELEVQGRTLLLVTHP